MNLRRCRVAAILLALAIACSAASAAETNAGFYIGGNLGQSKAKIDTAGIDATVRSTGLVAGSTTTASENDTGFKLFGGYRFHPNFAVEAGYFNLGKFGFTTVTTGPAVTLNGTAKSDNGFNVDLVGILPVNDVLSLFGRIGVQTSRTAVSLVGIGPGGTAAISSSETATNYKAGLGAQFDFTKTLGARAEWERYRLPGGYSGSSKGDVDLFSLGMVVRF